MTQVTSASMLVAVPPAKVYSAGLGLASRLWGVTDDDIVVAAPPSQLMHRVRLDDDIACWLTWDMTAVTDLLTRVVLLHDEVAIRRPPPPELDLVLQLLLDELGVVRPEGSAVT